jgi:hypothetical protein
MDEGFDGFIDKPVRAERVYQCLSEQLGIDYEYEDTVAEAVV